MRQIRYITPNGIAVTRTLTRVPYRKGLKHLLRELDTTRGFYLSSGYEYPGRYSRWDIASVRPPLEIAAAGRQMEFRPLNARGELLNRMLYPVLAAHPHWESFKEENGALVGRLRPLPELFPEEERSRQPSAFSILRALTTEFRNSKDNRLALVGAFGYDLLFQFDPIRMRLPRTGAKDLRLFLCDDIYFVDRMKEQISRYQYEFEREGLSTAGLPRTGEPVPQPAPQATVTEPVSDHTDEEYMAKVEAVRQGMRRGDYYEVVLRRTFRAPFSGSPSELFRSMQLHSPSPYEFFLQFGDEQLVGCSPEMFVRIEGNRVETCPISGTARRTGDPLRDAENIRELLNSRKEESELTMCTDVDRNDKSRIAVPGSVKVLGRRLIEAYAGLFHTVDHVAATIKPGFDALDAFLSQMWAVTMIGAPKRAAAQAIEDLEKDPRGWYGGAIGMLSLNGDMNTGITIRTIHIRDGVASYSAGATILYDSVPELEAEETRLKATAFFRALKGRPQTTEAAVEVQPRVGEGVRLLLVDNDDCFIHTLANYARQTGAEVVTYRSGFPMDLIGRIDPAIILISPGPGRPEDFGVPQLVRYAAQAGIPVFGVCLGLQGMVEAFGGELGVLDYPMHGKPSIVIHKGVGVFEGLPERFKVGRYHSLYARKDKMPDCLEVTAESEDGVIMGVRHRELPLEAVQFHPESILTLEGDCGLKLMRNVVRIYGRLRQASSAATAPHREP
ncbi:MAG TPA: anthranilate synthase component I [Bryobacteraceae bacterium]|nr:anthranilate synthase component I [Bryobacteraceae bacterium]HOL69825.1 anthranilate synthase component I [Bryobacteraceae bacterium]HOQ45198.1 anthranilate synthase component I [Bryobacteraceae bacterium]HPQ16763.1 anthranilate synthase component I [Bryobacteraceae bacterium]HPU71270.1 anthranilate synthase component I [Bryobacteraceae bacterium]